jgi:iron complex outermembrane receptor protein
MLMRKLVWCLAAALVTTFLITGAVGADDNEGDVLQLQDLVVTATRTETPLEDAPGSISVITQEDLAKQNIHTVDEALRFTPGLFAKRTKGMMDSTSSIYIRGFKGDQYTLLLVDGQPINDAYTGGVEWGILPVNNIERIEVIRGPASALYGGNAMGGVINIITKTPEKLEMLASGGYGSNDTYRYRLSAGDLLWDRLSVQIGYEEEDTDGYPTTPAVRSITSGSGNVSGGYAMDDVEGNATRWVVGDKGDNGAFHRVFNFKSGLKLSDTGSLTLSVISGSDGYDYGPPNSYMGTFGSETTYAVAGTNQRARFQPNDFIDSTGIGRNDTDIWNLSFKELFGPVTLRAQAGILKSDDRYTLETGSGNVWYDNSPGSLKITENTTLFGEISGDVPITDSHLLTVGVSNRGDESDTNDYNVPFYRSYSNRGNSTFYSGGEAHTWGLFAQDEWRVLPPLTLYLGARYDYWTVDDGASGVPGALTTYESNTESELSPKAAAVWKVLPDTTVRGSVGHAFRAPTLYELYRSWVSGSTTTLSNPDLKPETVWAYELGVDQFLFDKKTRLAVVGYWNDIEDMIYFRTEGNTKTRTNIGEARTYGVELEAEQKLTDWLSVWGNFTYTHARIEDNPTDPESEGKKVTGIPEYAWSAGVDATYKWCRASLMGRYYDKIYGNSDNSDTAEGVYGSYEPAFFLDAKVTVSPLKWMEVSLSVENILDEEYFEYYKSDGCTVFAELTLKY